MRHRDQRDEIGVASLHVLPVQVQEDGGGEQRDATVPFAERSLPEHREQQRGGLQVKTGVGVAFVLGADRLMGDALQQVLVDLDVGTQLGFTDREQVVGRERADRGQRPFRSSRAERKRSRARSVNPVTAARWPHSSR